MPITILLFLVQFDGAKYWVLATVMIAGLIKRKKRWKGSLE
jgi:hypothetical protein